MKYKNLTAKLILFNLSDKSRTILGYDFLYETHKDFNLYDVIKASCDDLCKNFLSRNQGDEF